MWGEIVLLFKNYIGNGFAACLFAAAVFYLLFTEKDKTKRIILLYTSIATLALFSVLCLRQESFSFWMGKLIIGYCGWCR